MGFGTFFLFCFLITCYCLSVPIFAADRIRTGESIRDGDTVVSAGRRFALGFFSPRNSSFRYVGIWYHRIANESAAVWVANRDRPISGNGGVLTIGAYGNLTLSNGNGEVVWSSSRTVATGNSTAVLMDTGNLVLTENSGREVLWQSFDNPTDTFLPDMRVHFTFQEGERRVFTSWASSVDPSPGNYSMGIDPRGSPQIVIWEGQNRRWRSGHWNGLAFTGVPDIRAVYSYGFRLLNERSGSGRVYFIYTISNSSNAINFRLNWEGTETQERWNDSENSWNVIQSHPVEECDRYNHCGPFGKCNQRETPRCSCMEGFVPVEDGDWSNGCSRRTQLQCGQNDGFLQIVNVKLPDYVDYVGSEDVTGCENRCLENCSCTAYAFVNGINCMIWTHDLVDIQQFEEGGGSLFIRLARSELRGDTNRVTKVVAIAAATVGSAVLAFVFIWLFCLSRRRKCTEIINTNPTSRVGPSGEISGGSLGACDQLSTEGDQTTTGTELAMFSFNCVAAATDNFSDKNELGHGGFGDVYKGTLPGGQEIAVKRLSRKSGQGLEEFKNEITVIAKLQHRNLVRLLGYCTQGDERMLIYEYMSNNSLESYLFDSDKKALLGWSKRLSIIEGIARGLLYLHRDSRLRIIHRDLKASNILLDEDMNPKISDFGMAKIFGGSLNDANATNRVVGTYGYMAPEYAMEGLFSLKSDVYSFGVLLLELITGQRNASFRSTGHTNIIGYAWDLWKRGRAIELLDPSISKTCRDEQVVRCIQIGMLCVQDVAGQRPDMQAVVLMLESENAGVAVPREPTFTSMRHDIDSEMWNRNLDVVSSNNVTVSVILGR